MNTDSPLLFSLEGAKHFAHKEPVPSHFVATVIRGALCNEAILEAEIAHLHEIIEQFCMDAERFSGVRYD